MNHIVVAAGIACFTLGLTIVLGWHFHISSIVQWSARGAAMQYNTALSLVFSGAVLLLIRANVPVAAAACSVPPLLLSALNACQYLLNVDLGIDRLFVTPFLTAGAPHPGRMAPNTTLCFLLTGVVLLRVSLKKSGVIAERPADSARPSIWEPVLPILAAIAFSLAAVAAIGYIAGIESAYTWGSFIRMALNTSLGFLVLSAGIIVLLWRDHSQSAKGSPRWLPYILAIGVVTFSLGLYQALAAEQHAKVSLSVEAQANNIRNEITARMQSRFSSLTTLREIWTRNQHSASEWQSDATLFINLFQGTDAIAWVDSSLRVERIAPVERTAAQNSDIRLDETIGAAAPSSLNGHELRIANWTTASGEKQIYVFVPLYPGAQLNGFVVGVYSVKQMLDVILENVSRGYSISISSSGDELYLRSADRDYEAEYSQYVNIELNGANWQIRIWPSSDLMPGFRSILPKVVLSAGTIVALLMALMLHLAQGARLRASEVVEANHALENEILAREQVQHHLYRSKQMLNLVLNNIPQRVFWKDPDSRYLGCNLAFLKDAGLHDVDEIIGKSDVDLFWKDMAEQYRADELVVMQTKTPRLNFEEPQTRPDGSSLCLKTSKVALLDEAGEAIGILGTYEDITERKKAEVALFKSEGLLRAVVETMPVGVWITDETGKITSGNSAGEKIWGETRLVDLEHYNEYKGWRHDTGERIQSEEWALAQAVLTRQPVTGQVADIECFDGNRKTVICSAVPLLDHNRELIAAVVIVEDVTERIAAEKALRKSETGLKQAQQIANVGSWEWDIDTGTFDWSEQTYRQFGFTPGEFEPTFESFQQYIHPDDLVAFEASVQQALVDRTPIDLEIRVVQRSGEVRILHARGETPTVGDGPSRRMFGVCLDITQRKQTEEALRSASNYNRSLIEASLDPLVTIGPDGTITDVNVATESVTGYNRQALIGTDFSDYFTEPQKARAGYETVFRESAVRDYPLEIKHHNGGAIPVLYNAAVYRDEAGKVIGVFAAARDITERKRAEQLIQDLNASLERRVVERTAQLETANKELEAFSYSVSHDLRAPLRSIDGFSQALLEDYADTLDEEGRSHLRRVRAAAQRMSELIDAMLLLSRVTRSDLNFESVNLSRMARAIAKDLQQRDPNRKATFLIQDGLAIKGDATLMKVLMENLLENAWKFTSKHSEARIEFGATNGGGETVYFVRDDGVGFDMDYLNNLFTAFHRLHGITEYPGTGIGLATVQRIINRHGGRVWAEGAPEQGATFYFAALTRDEASTLSRKSDTLLYECESNGGSK